MSFFPKKMSQNDWATILPFGPVTLIFYWPKKKFRASQRLALISGTIIVIKQFMFVTVNNENTKQ